MCKCKSWLSHSPVKILIRDPSPQPTPCRFQPTYTPPYLHPPSPFALRLHLHLILHEQRASFWKHPPSLFKVPVALCFLKINLSLVRKPCFLHYCSLLSRSHCLWFRLVWKSQGRSAALLTKPTTETIVELESQVWCVIAVKCRWCKTLAKDRPLGFMDRLRSNLFFGGVKPGNPGLVW